MDTKKISFGFNKVTKKPNLLQRQDVIKTEPKVELIKCVEGQEIKLIEEKPEESLLIIPMKENQKTSAALASLRKRRAVLLGEEEEEEEEPQVSEGLGIVDAVKNGVNGPENLEKQAERELLAELEAKDLNNKDSELVLPIVKPDELPLDGAKESTLDDYETIPIQEFGMAMLRGMGWVEPPKTIKSGGPPVEAPFVRPKGMGLGADKALKPKALLIAPEKNEILEIKRQAYVRILGGKHKDLYGQIEGFDDHAGRVIVKMAIGGSREAFNEFLCQPVSRKEYAQYGKCINNSKYEEYQKKKQEQSHRIIKEDEQVEKRKSDKDMKDDGSAEKNKSDLNKSRYSKSNKYKEDEEKTFKSESTDRYRKDYERLNRTEEHLDSRYVESRYERYNEHSSRSTEHNSSKIENIHSQNERTQEKTNSRVFESTSDSVHKQCEVNKMKSRKHKKKKSKSKSTSSEFSTDSEKNINYRTKKHKKKSKKHTRERSRSRSRTRR